MKTLKMVIMIIMGWRQQNNDRHIKSPSIGHSLHSLTCLAVLSSDYLPSPAPPRVHPALGAEKN